MGCLGAPTLRPGGLVDVDQGDHATDDEDVREQSDNGDDVSASRSLVRASLVSRGSTRIKTGSSETATPVVTREAASAFPSSAIAHNDPNSVAPKTSAKKSCSRAAGSSCLSRLAAPSRSKYRISQSRAPATANSIAIVDWKN